MIRHLLCVMIICYGLAAHAATAPSINLNNPMVADISQHAVEIRASFSGAQLLIFGARNVPGDLAIVVRGPESNIVMRRKERIAGMWMHVEQHKYFDVPQFYALAATKPLETLSSPELLQALGLGAAQITAHGNSKPNSLFDDALSATMTKKRWWQLPLGKISYFSESLFKARLDLPDTLPGGLYTVEVYLFNDSHLVAVQTIPLEVYKTGFEARLVEASKHQAPFYGILAILMALGGGWLAHRLFHRG